MNNHIITTLIVSFCLFVSSCNDKQQELSTTENQSAPAISADTNTAVYVDSTLMTQSVKHAFSDPAQQDSFVLVVAGKSLLEAQVTFNIYSPNGTVLYTQTFPSNYLIGYGLIDVEHPTVQQQEEYLAKRIRAFFDEKNFISNPLKKATFEKQYADKETWEDIQSDPTAIGFYYLIGKEDGRRIAYSKKKKAVVLYYNCC